MPWGDFLHSGTVKVKGRTEPLKGWRDTDPDRARIPASVAHEGEIFVAGKVKDMTVLGSRPVTPPPTHVEAPSA